MLYIHNMYVTYMKMDYSESKDVLPPDRLSLFGPELHQQLHLQLL